jgi:hypothetical protein
MDDKRRADFLKDCQAVGLTGEEAVALSDAIDRNPAVLVSALHSALIADPSSFAAVIRAVCLDETPRAAVASKPPAPNGLEHIRGTVQKLARRIKASGPTPIQRRLMEAAARSELQSVIYQHTVLCQTYLPYRNPGDNVLSWDRRNGGAHLEITAGKALYPDQRGLVQLGLPFGPRARLVLMHINQRAITSQSPHIDMGDSLTDFVRRVLKLDPMGRNIDMVKEQLGRLSAAHITLGVANDNTAITHKLEIVKSFNVWFPKDERQRVLWPSYVDLSHEYWETLKAHAVPLDEDHIAALSHSGLALDIYAWLAERLHRVPVNKPQFISWTALHQQFGQGYTGDQAIKKFRQAFTTALKQVRTVYDRARIEEDGRHRPRLVVQAGKEVWREEPAKGLSLHNSPPPVRIIAITKPS